MTPQEQQLIDGLISRIRNTQVQSKDSEAEQHIQTALAGFPDALYVLVQTVLVQQYGLQQAQSQLDELKQANQLLQSKLEQTASQTRPSGGGSFLSHIFGGSGGTPNQPAPQPPPQSQYQPVNNPGYGQSYPAGAYPPPPPPPYPAQGYPAPAGGGMFGGGGGGFLQGALQTAAGVAAGEMVFQGMEDLFHGFGGHERGFGGGMGGGETVVNNYYDEDRGRDRDSGDRNRDDGGFYNPDSDASRSNFGDSSLGTSDGGSFGGDSTDFADTDTASDDSGLNDSSGFDSSGDDLSSSDDNS